MTIARSLIVDGSITRIYHCISRCVRGANLLEKYAESPEENRKSWLENRLEFLDDIFAVAVASYSIMSNHLHVLLRLDSDVAADWSPKEVAERWFRLYPPRGKKRRPLTETQLKALIVKHSSDKKWVAEHRERLGSLSWFMKCLKEPLARMANKAENCTGAFFEGRFKSIAVLDEEALLSTLAYIDLNPVAAGIADVPENSDYTSFKARCLNLQRKDGVEEARAYWEGSVACSKALEGVEDDHWLIPIEDRRGQGGSREGLLPGFTLAQYMQLVDYTGRKDRPGKAKLAEGLSDILDRLGSTLEEWEARMEQLSSGKWYGCFFAGNQDRVTEVAKQLDRHHLINLSARCVA